MRRFITIFVWLAAIGMSWAAEDGLRVGAERSELYLPVLRGRNIAVVSNQTGVVPVRHHAKTGQDSTVYVHMVDMLLDSGIRIQKIFSPEHGFRGQAEAGAAVKN